MRAEADRVRRDEREIASTVAQRPADGELRERGGLADAGWTNECNPSALIEPAVAGDEQMLRQSGNGEAPRLREVRARRQLCDDLSGEVMGESYFRELPQELGLDGRAAAEIVPGELRELRFEDAAHRLELAADARAVEQRSVRRARPAPVRARPSTADAARANTSLNAISSALSSASAGAEA